MLLIPAIDIKGGKCVRLKQGDAKQETIYYENPLDCARMWQEAGASRLHLVDLDGAFQGKSVSREIIGQIRAEFPELELQAGGGIRRREDVECYLDELQVNYVIIGTLAVQEPGLIQQLAQQFPQRIYLACDIRDGKINTHGWARSETAADDGGADAGIYGVADYLNQYADSPLAGVVATDIKNDGMLQGVDLEVFEQVADVASSVKLAVIAAGGITDLDDIKKLHASGKIFGAVCGKSIYEGSLDLKEALRFVASQGTA